MGGDLDSDPLVAFAHWFAAAEESEERAELMALATATPAGAPSVRMVELQRFGDDGFVFYSGLMSRKGSELALNPRAAICFYWHSLGHQARIEGHVRRTELEPDEARAASRTAASSATPTLPQDTPVVDELDLARRIARLRERFGEDAPPLPSDWGGFLLVPDAYEFWEYRSSRIHDRRRYVLKHGQWHIERLFP